MRTRLAALVAAIALAITFSPALPTGTVVADGICPAGSNWDNVLGHCK